MLRLIVTRPARFLAGRVQRDFTNCKVDHEKPKKPKSGREAGQTGRQAGSQAGRLAGRSSAVMPSLPAALLACLRAWPLVPAPARDCARSGCLSRPVFRFAQRWTPWDRSLSSGRPDTPEVPQECCA